MDGMQQAPSNVYQQYPTTDSIKTQFLPYYYIYTYVYIQSKIWDTF